MSFVQNAVQQVWLPEDHPVVIIRRQWCAQCPDKFAIPLLSGVLGENCKHCGCIIAAKTRVAFTHCPIGKW